MTAETLLHGLRAWGIDHRGALGQIINAYGAVQRMTCFGEEWALFFHLLVVRKLYAC